MLCIFHTKRNHHTTKCMRKQEGNEAREPSTTLRSPIQRPGRPPPPGQQDRGGVGRAQQRQGAQARGAGAGEGGGPEPLRRLGQGGEEGLDGGGGEGGRQPREGAGAGGGRGGAHPNAATAVLYADGLKWIRCREKAGGKEWNDCQSAEEKAAPCWGEGLL